MIRATCHCGNVKIQVPATIEVVTSCNCSVCRRYAALWAYFSSADVVLETNSEALSSYCWGDKTIEFHHCSKCGCVTHYTPTQLSEKDKVGVNFRLVDTSVLESLETRYFDGADSWTEIKK